MNKMKIFISSLVSGMEPLRKAARDGVAALGHEPIMVEDFGAQTTSPQVACLDGLRQADAVVLILGERYGVVQASGLSATHEEYKEARGRKPVLAFVQQGAEPDPQQMSFLAEVQSWEGGLFRSEFAGAVDLQQKVTRGLHEWQMSNSVGAIDSADLLTRAIAQIPRTQSQMYVNSSSIIVSITVGPAQAILRPAQMEDPTLAEGLAQEALFGKHRIFNQGSAWSKTIAEHSLVLSQGAKGPVVSLDEQGSILVTFPIGGFGARLGLPVLIEEDVYDKLSAALSYADWLLGRIDPTRRLTHVAIAVKINGSGLFGWRTRAQHQASPNQIFGGESSGSGDRAAVHLSPPHRSRAALRQEAESLVQDLLVLLRRQWK